ncbi:MAG: helix-turn-helix transcriptional regulator [Clostridia bacterium]|nr:helix-turn-helix transcriptional regulator [Clostridia bacterium]
MTYDHRVTGQIIRGLREKRGLTQEVLSGLAAISRSHLAEIESGRTNANVETLWRISEALGMRCSDLMRAVEQVIESG